MRVLSLFSLLLLLVTPLSAQVPQNLSYQAVARDNQGICLADQTLSLQVSIVRDSANGAKVYIERFENNVLTNSVGHFQISIGAGTPQAINGTLPTFPEINWNNSRHFLQIEYAPGASTAFQHVGTTELLTVPYAMVAGNGKQYSATNQDEFLRLLGKNKNRNISIGGRADDTGDVNNGAIVIANKEGTERASMYAAQVAQGAYGRINLSGANGKKNIELSVRSGASNPNHGAMYLYNEDGDIFAYHRISTNAAGEDFGEVVVEGPNGNHNVVIGARAMRNNGQVLVRDVNGTSQCGLFVEDDGRGRLFADVKTFVMPHPTLKDKDIVYASIEGPEVAAYERGTATLKNGEAEILFSESFSIVGNPETMTVSITPRSPYSEGLAAFEYSATGFKVKELRGGTGNYEFDWKVEAVRKGYEDWQVIQDKIDAPAVSPQTLTNEQNTLPNDQ